MNGWLSFSRDSHSLSGPYCDCFLTIFIHPSKHEIQIHSLAIATRWWEEEMEGWFLSILFFNIPSTLLSTLSLILHPLASYCCWVVWDFSYSTLFMPLRLFFELKRKFLSLLSSWERWRKLKKDEKLTLLEKLRWSGAGWMAFFRDRYSYRQLLWKSPKCSRLKSL